MDELVDLILRSPKWLFSNIARGTIPKKTLFVVFGLTIPAAVVGYIFGSYLDDIFWRLVFPFFTGMLGFGVATGMVYLHHFLRNPPPEYQELGGAIQSLFAGPKQGGIPKKGLLIIFGIAFITTLCVYIGVVNSLVFSLVCGGLVFIFGAIAAEAYFKP